jgi:hypothetical protein
LKKLKFYGIINIENKKRGKNMDTFDIFIQAEEFYTEDFEIDYGVEGES